MPDQITIMPQPGYQELILSTPADIAIGGSGAGVGKTQGLLMESVRHNNVKGFEAVIFRRTQPQIKGGGGLWDKSMDMYPLLGGVPKESVTTWVFNKGMKIKFSHLEYDKNVLDHQGLEYAFIGFDELTHFSKYQFFYLLTRNRSTCGIKPYVRATCNPDPDSWVADFIEWFIGEDGFPIPERSGVLRYFVVQNDNYVWGGSKDEVIEKVPELAKEALNTGANVYDWVKSMTFIPGSIYDNKKLLSVDPGYLANLLSQDETTKMQLLSGNWKIRTDGLGLFNYDAANNIFSNYAETKGKKYITCDASRFGRDYTVIMVWQGWTVVKTIVEYKTEAKDIVSLIEEARKSYQVQLSDCLVDQDGVGDGTVKLGNYKGFHGGAMALKFNGIKENYANLKTQCYYRISEKVNMGLVRIEINNETVKVAGAFGTKVKNGSKVEDIRDLIKADMKAIKRDKPDSEGKKRINDKADQKIILNGRSPDFIDCLMMREFFELRVPEYGIGSIPAEV